LKNGLLLLCTTLLLATASPSYSAFSPAVKVLVLEAKEGQKGEVQSASFSALQTALEVQKHQRLGFWKRLKIKLLRQLLPTDGETQLLAFVIGIFLGLFGVHRFHLGYKGEGLAYLLITFSCILIILTGASIAALTGPAIFFAALRLALYILGALSIWLIVDLIRIAAGTLRPKSEL
jgi:TM2 domain-containing membrane protein YozV